MSFDQTLQDLRNLLSSASNLEHPWDLFQDELAMQQGFLRLGEKRPNAALEMMLEATCAIITRRPAKLEDTLFIHLPRNHFWHGSMHVGTGVAIVLFFDAHENEPARGLLAYVPKSRKEDTSLVRISPVAMPEAPLGTWVTRGPIAQA